MLVRLLLVSMVAGLGISAPTPRQVDEWSRSARSCWRTALVGWDALMPATAVAACDPTPAETAGEPPIAEVIRGLAEARAFENAVDEMAESFVVAQEIADLQAMTRSVAVTPPPVAAPGVPSEACLGEDAVMEALAAAEATPAVESSSEPEPERGGPARLDRLASAVRLTRDAARAWSALLRSDPSASGLRR